MFRRIKAFMRLHASKSILSRLDEIEHLFYCRTSDVANLTIERLDLQSYRRGNKRNKTSRFVPILRNCLF